MKTETPQQTIARLENCIKAFKEYDSGRKKYIKQIEHQLRVTTDEQTKLKKELFKLHDDYETLLECCNNAKGTVLDPSIKAVYAKMIETIQTLKKELKKEREKVQYLSGLSTTDTSLLDELEELKQRLTTYKQHISNQERTIQKLLKDAKNKRTNQS